MRPAQVHVGETDDVALQAALDLRNRQGGTVTVASVGDERADACLQRCLERGADRALRIEYAPAGGETDTTVAAWLLAEIVRSERAELVFCASRSGDLGSGFFPYALASAAAYALVTGVIEFELAGASLTAVRKLERGWRERYRLELPVVIAVEDELVRPRHVAVLGRSHRQALSLSVECRSAPALNVDGKRSSALLETDLTLPQPRRRPVARNKPRGSSRDRLRRKRSAATAEGGEGSKQAVRLDGEPEDIAKQLVASIRGWLEKVNDESTS